MKTETYQGLRSSLGSIAVYCVSLHRSTRTCPLTSKPSQANTRFPQALIGPTYDFTLHRALALGLA